MNNDRALLTSRVSADVFVAADLNAACRWFIESRDSVVRFAADDLPALGKHTRLKMSLPITAPRALMCTVWLVEEVRSGACLLAGQLRFVAHPTASDGKLSLEGRTAAAPRTLEPQGQRANAARQLLVQIAAAIERPRALARSEAAV